MAYSSLVSLEKTIDEILNDSRYSISSYGKQHIISLDKYVVSFRTFIEDCPEKAAKNLEARIRDVAMKAEDIIEWHMNQQIRHYVFRYVHWIAELKRLKFEYQLQKVRDEMDSIAGEVVEMKNGIITKDAPQQLDDSVIGAGSSSSSSQVTDGAAGKMKMVGLNEDLLEIKDRLCGRSRQLQILPVTGMGGIGKTTLARTAYNDPLIMEHFQIRVWITVSQDYSKERILSDLVNSMKEFFPERRNKSMAKKDNESLEENSQEAEETNIEKAEKVHKALFGRRFLIVLDDVWSTKVLDDAKLFPNNDNGSRILLTTRLGDVADSSTSAPSHEMSLMGEDQSWNLLQEKVLEHHDRIPNELEKIGREIARRCAGLPLAVVVVAGLLSTVSMTQTSWEEISRKVKSSLTITGDGQIEKILSLSYNHLPHHLRPCFLYMGGFPEDDEIKATKLMRLWIAEGFVKPVTSKSPEDSAQEYMEDLIKRNLVVVSKSKSNGEIKNGSLHDLVRDLCIKQSQDEKFLVHVKGVRAMESFEGVRRISISHSDNIRSLANISSSTIRTIMYFQDTLTGSFGSFRLLRVIDMLSVPFRSRVIPDQFFELFHLRYLALWYDTDNNVIPRAISNLQRLQTLIVKNYCRISREIWNMPRLRHLVFLGFFFSTGPASALGNLQTLGKVTNLKCSSTLVQMFPNLKKLHLNYFWKTGDLLLHNLVHLSSLEKLMLELSYRLDSSAVAPELVLPSSLKKLVLIRWGRNEPYLSIHNIGSLPNLQVLKLRKFDFATREWWITGDQDFPKLRFLEITESDLTRWDIQGSSPFPVLEKLLITSCWSLSGIPDSIGEIPTLESVVVRKCKTSLADCVRRIQQEQLEYRDDVFQVHCTNCVPSPKTPYDHKRLEVVYSLLSIEYNIHMHGILCSKSSVFNFSYKCACGFG